MTSKTRASIFIHPQAIVEPGARLGQGTRVWAYAHVMAKARLGTDCNIGNYVFVENGVTLGNGVTVKNGAQLWEGVSAEDDVFIGPGCVFTNHLNPRAFIKLPKSQWLVRTRLQKGCTLGAGATLLSDLSIGRYAFVAAGALVTKDVADFAMVMGSPARFHSWRCLCTETLRFSGNAGRCPECGSRFRLNKNAASLQLLQAAPRFKHA